MSKPGLGHNNAPSGNGVIHGSPNKRCQPPNSIALPRPKLPCVSVCPRRSHAGGASVQRAAMQRNATSRKVNSQQCASGASVSSCNGESGGGEGTLVP